MKKFLAALLVLVLTVSMMAGCGGAANSSSAASPTPSDAPSSESGAGEAPAEAPAGWKPTKNVEWIVTSSPGGGSDIYTRTIQDIMVTGSMLDQTILVNNKTDGGGEVGRAQVSATKAGDQANHTLLTFNSGDLMPMVLNTQNRIEDFTPIALMAVDKQLLFKGEHTAYADFSEAIEAAKNGTVVVVGGSKGDDVATFAKLLEEIGLTESEMPYITHDATSDAITAILGGHIDFVISKPAAATEYVEAGRLVPVLALSNERYGGALADAPTLSEIGDYSNVEVPVWRGVVGPKDMSPEAAAFWTDVLKQVSESEQWKTNYLDKNMLIGNYMNADEAAAFMKQYQDDYMAKEGLQ